MIDKLIVLIYLIALLFMGIWHRSKAQNLRGYTDVDSASGKSKLILVATIFASSIGGGTTFGISEKIFASNAAYTYGLLFTIPIDLIVAKYIVPRMIVHRGAQTVGDIMYSYYGMWGRIIAGFAATAVSIGFVAAQISVSGRIFEYILNVNYLEGIFLSYGIVIIYTTIGGLQSIIFTNLIQFFAMIIAIPLITFSGLNQIGFGSFLSAIPRDKVLFLDNNTLLTDTICVTLGLAVMGLYPNVIQRILINKDSNATTKAIYIKSGVLAVFLICVSFNGLIAYNLYPEQAPALSLTYLIDHILPVGLLGFVVVDFCLR